MSAKIRGKLLILHRKTENDDENTKRSHNISTSCSPCSGAIRGKGIICQRRQISHRSCA